jgi:SAGA-associated factor 29
MLHELVSLVKQTQSEREASEHTLNGIAKTHDRMKNEQRISPYFKQKLQGLYHNALQDAKRELAQVEQALDKVSEIKQEIGEKQSRPVTQPLNFEDIQARKSGMRRGMLMTVLQQYAHEQDVWRGKPGESLPPLTGAISADEKHKCKPEDQVAARVRTEDGEEQWILAEVVSYNSHNHRYVVDDIDEEGHNEKRRYHVSKRRIIPLPRYKVDPKLHPQALFKPKQLVLALYPQTTCFYRAIIHEQPSDINSEYSVLFEDTTYPDGYSPPLDVPQRYVLPVRETRKK